jgi:FkbM family methyltransferase
VIAFEPDRAARVLDEEDQVTVVQGALWSRAEEVPLHVTHEPTCSSVHPPDLRLVAGFSDPVGRAARTVERVEHVPGVALDDVVAESNLPEPDLIKLDIHGSEWEALTGARRCLRDSVVAVLVECWPVRIHSGQHSFGETHQLLEESGFMLFDVDVGRWPRRHDGHSGRLASRPQATQFEAFYMLDLLGDRAGTVPRERLLMTAAVAELFGHGAYAQQVAHAGRDAGVLTQEESETVSRLVTARDHVSGWQWIRSKIAGRIVRSLRSRIVEPVD